MRLLIVTEAVDEAHPILGFVIRWIEEFSRHAETVHVICLEAGEYSLSSNVQVHSLGKEAGAGRVAYLARLWQYSWQLRGEYDAVFVHMNPIYLVAGGLLWRGLGKRAGLWYTHGSVSFSLRVAAWLAHRVFTASPESFPLASRKLLVTGHGIDTKHFAPQEQPAAYDLITVGRIATSKQLGTLVEVLARIQTEYPRATLAIVGRAVTPEEEVYERTLRQAIKERELTDAVHFLGPVSQRELPTVLARARVFVHAATNGSLDKAVLEAMACGLPVVSSAPGSASLPLGAAHASDLDALTAQVAAALASGERRVPAHRAYVEANHSLGQLVPKLLDSLAPAARS